MRRGQLDHHRKTSYRKVDVGARSGGNTKEFGIMLLSSRNCSLRSHGRRKIYYDLPESTDISEAIALLGLDPTDEILWQGSKYLFTEKKKIIFKKPKDSRRKQLFSWKIVLAYFQMKYNFQGRL